MGVSNTCTCLTLPGSGGTCAPHQIAICRSDGFNCVHECRDSIPPEMLKQIREQMNIASHYPQGSFEWQAVAAAGEGFANTALSEIVGLPQALPPLEAVGTLLSGEQFLPGGAVVTFELPNEMKEVVAQFGRDFT